MQNEPECYGKMFPSLLEIPHNRFVTGTIFWVPCGLPRRSGDQGCYGQGRGLAQLFERP